MRERPAAGRTRDRTYPPPPEPLRTPVLDSHCHLDIRDGEAWMEVGEALAASTAVGVTRIVQIGCDLAGARWAVDVAASHRSVVAGVSLHPNEAPRIHAEQGRRALEQAWDEIDALAGHERVRAVGESGLDYFRTEDGEGRKVQEESFRRHIVMAREHDKALVIHDRDAHDDVVRLLLDEGAPRTVVFHCYSGDVAMARTCVEHGWVLSFAGTVTFKNAQVLRDALAVTPTDQLLVETDAPFLTPTPYRGRPNASFLVPLTVRAMAQVKGIDVDELCGHLDATGTRVFGSF